MFIHFLVYFFLGCTWIDLKCNILIFSCESEKIYDIVKIKWVASLLCVFFDVIFWPISSIYYLNKLTNLK